MALESPPLILLSGMGADERLFEHQRAFFGDRLITPRWIAPIENDSIASYAARLARTIDPHRPCYVGGTSFGGFVAMEMANHLQTISVFLIASVREPRELPPKLRALKPIRHFLRHIPFELATMSAEPIARASGSLTTGATRDVLEQFSDADAVFLRWASQAVLDWETAPAPRATVFQIHGAADPILPARSTRPDVVVRGAAHLITLTHANEVNNFLNAHMHL